MMPLPDNFYESIRGKIYGTLLPTCPSDGKRFDMLYTLSRDADHWLNRPRHYPNWALTTLPKDHFLGTINGTMLLFACTQARALYPGNLRDIHIFVECDEEGYPIHMK